MDGLQDMLVKPVEGHEDIFAFQFDFPVSPEGKAETMGLSSDSITELDDGDLLIEGYAAVFDGLDRQGENFVPGAFQRGIKSFLDNNGALCYHHNRGQCIGKVLTLAEEPDKGLKIRARVDKQEPTSPLFHIYNGIKKGSIRQLSVGGFFKRDPSQRKIVDMDFTEISTTPVAIHPRTNFAVIAGKALGTLDEQVSIPTDTYPAADEQKLEDFLTAVRNLSNALMPEGKALPDTHDPEDAQFLADLLAFLGKTRSFVTRSKNDPNDEGVLVLAEEIESKASAWEAKAHELAAKKGPLPTSPYAGYGGL